MTSTKTRIEKRRETNLKKYGVEVAFTRPEIFETFKKHIKESRAREMEYDGDFYTKEETIEKCKNLGDEYYGSGNFRKLLIEDKKFYFSIIKYSEEMENVKHGQSLTARIKFLKGEFKRIKCPYCGEYYKFLNNKKTISYICSNCKKPKIWSEEYCFLNDIDYNEKRKEITKQRKASAKKCKVRINSKECFIKKYGEEEGLKRYLSHNKKVAASNHNISESSKKFFEKLIELAKLDKSKCFYGKNEKCFLIPEEFKNYLNQSYVFPDFLVGKKIIEFNGKYWHSSNEKRIIDFKRKIFFENLGYEVLIVWDKTENELERALKFINSNRFKVLTSEGFSDFEGIRKTKADKTLKITLEDNNQIEVSENHIFIIQSKNIKANTLKIGDYLEVKNNILKRILNIEVKNEQKDVFDIVETKNHSYFANNILNHNCSFLGSSLTLPSAETLDKLSNSTKEPEYLRDSRLKIYKEPQKDHIYFLAVDPAKSGEDAFAIQIVDLTSKPFEQVATAQLFKCNFQKMPVFIVEWGEIYNNAFIIIENNEGAGTYISSVLKLSYDYPNLFYEKKKGKIADLEPGFRTTQKTRPQILDILKSFLDDEILILHDAETVSELSTFILKNDKYQADDGCHDDLVMSLALIFAPFCDIKNFDDIEWVISYLYDPEKACKDTSKFYEHFVIGNFDSFDDDSYELSNKISEYNDSDFGDFSQLEDGFDDYYNNY